MKFIKELKEGDRVFDIYLCKHKQEAVTKNGIPYESVILQDKTGTIDAKVWEPNNPGIGDYDDLDYIEVYGDVTNFQGQLQISVKRIRVCREGEYNPSDYLPVSSKGIDTMYNELKTLIGSIKYTFLHQLMQDLRRNSATLLQPRQCIMVSWADCWSRPWELPSCVTTTALLILFYREICF